VSAGKATLLELQTDYGTEDAHNLLDIILVDAENAARAREAKK